MIRIVRRVARRLLMPFTAREVTVPLDGVDRHGVHLRPETFLRALGLAPFVETITESSRLDMTGLIGIGLNTLNQGGEKDGGEVLYQTANTLLSMGRVDLATPIFKAFFDRTRTTSAHQAYLHSLLLNPKISGDDLYRAATEWSHLYVVPDDQILTPNTVTAATDQRLRIGYVCEFFDSSVMRSAMLPTIGRLDRNRFETFCYSDGPIPQDMIACSEHWRETETLSNRRLAEVIHADKIDILVDLSGPTHLQRFGTYAMRPAPLQMGGPNYAATSGLPFFDFMVASEDLIPREHEAHFTEKIVKSPYFQAFSTPAQPYYTEQVPVSPPPAIKNGYITFGYFGSTHKLNAHCVRHWSAILKGVPTAKLVLKAAGYDHALIRDSIQDLFEENGIAKERLEFRGQSEYRAMLAEYGDIDIALDAQPVSGGATMNDLLWQGVPCISILGSRLSARHGAVRLSLGGLGDCVGHTTDDCVQIAQRLAADIEGLKARRLSQRSNLLNTKLFDAAGFMDALANAFLTTAGR